MQLFRVPDPDFAVRVRQSFLQQKLMATVRAELVAVEAGRVAIEMPFAQEFTQQNGFIHAGIVTAIADSACGYAALTLMRADAEVLSVEFKINLLSPAIGQKLVARAEVLKPGKTLTICRGDVFAVSGGQEKLVAAMQATMIARKRSE